MRVVLKLLPEDDRERAAIGLLNIARGLEREADYEEEFTEDFELARAVIKSAMQILSVGKSRGRVEGEGK